MSPESTNFWITLIIVAMISGSRVLRAAVLKSDNFDWDNITGSILLPPLSSKS
jgi:hypothetical protein